MADRIVLNASTPHFDVIKSRIMSLILMSVIHSVPPFKRANPCGQIVKYKSIIWKYEVVFHWVFLVLSHLRPLDKTIDILWSRDDRAYRHDIVDYPKMRCLRAVQWLQTHIYVHSFHSCRCSIITPVVLIRTQ